MSTHRGGLGDLPTRTSTSGSLAGTSALHDVSARHRSSVPTRLDKLPTEVLERIADFADPLTRLSLASTNSKLRSQLEAQRRADAIVLHGIPQLNAVWGDYGDDSFFDTTYCDEKAFNSVLREIQRLPRHMQGQTLPELAGKLGELAPEVRAIWFHYVFEVSRPLAEKDRLATELMLCRVIRRILNSRFIRWERMPPARVQLRVFDMLCEAAEAHPAGNDVPLISALHAEVPNLAPIIQAEASARIPKPKAVPIEITSDTAPA